MEVQVPAFLDAFEQMGLSRGLRETQSFFGYYFILAAHTLGLALAVGSNAVINLRLLGFAPDIPVPPLKRLFSLIWIGLAVNAVSGVLLVVSYPVKSLTNPVFFLKLALIGLATWVLVLIKKRVFDQGELSQWASADSGRALAAWSLIIWVGVFAAGRSLAYTCNYLLSGVPC